MQEAGFKFLYITDIDLYERTEMMRKVLQLTDDLVRPYLLSVARCIVNLRWHTVNK